MIDCLRHVQYGSPFSFDIYFIETCPNCHFFVDNLPFLCDIFEDFFFIILDIKCLLLCSKHFSEFLS